MVRNDVINICCISQKVKRLRRDVVPLITINIWQGNSYCRGNHLGRGEKRVVGCPQYYYYGVLKVESASSQWELFVVFSLSPCLCLSQAKRKRAETSSGASGRGWRNQDKIGDNNVDNITQHTVCWSHYFFIIVLTRIQAPRSQCHRTLPPLSTLHRRRGHSSLMIH